MEPCCHDETYLEFVYEVRVSLGCLGACNIVEGQGRSFWQVCIPQICSWSWRKLLKLRDDARYFILFYLFIIFLLVLERIYIFGLIPDTQMGCFMRSMGIVSFMMLIVS
jgi:hypothetical protein